jgi:hypothetical protein
MVSQIEDIAETAAARRGEVLKKKQAGEKTGEASSMPTR